MADRFGIPIRELADLDVDEVARLLVGYLRRLEGSAPNASNTLNAVRVEASEAGLSEGEARAIGIRVAGAWQWLRTHLFLVLDPVRAQFGRLPRPLDSVGSVVLLHDRTVNLSTRIFDLRDRVEDEVERMDKEAKAVADRMSAEADSLRENIRRVATGDVRLQMAGLGLVVGGILLQGVGIFFG